VRFRCRGAGLRLVIDADTYDYTMPARDRSWELNSSDPAKILLTTLAAAWWSTPRHTMRADHVIIDLLPDEITGSAECALQAFDSTQEPSYEKSFDACTAEVRQEFENWLADLP
jgi:hypothetical protein